jgi:hypothetical protein
MSRNQNKKNVVASGTVLGGGGALLPEETSRVRDQIAGRHSKAALQLAKDLHKRCGTVESEALLVEAYQARIDDLLKVGMTADAKALLGIVNERFPAAAQRLADQRQEICALDGRLEEVVGPLGDPDLQAKDRDRIETFIRQRIHDLPALAAASSLPAEHPLRVAAAAIAAAFQAVTEGPVEDETLALPEVSRRNPLASWKALVRAIASYYRREDEECGKWLLAVADDSVPARLIPALAAMRATKLKTKQETKAESRFSPAEEKLITVAGDHGAVLRPALAALEKAFLGKKQRTILDAARIVVEASDRCDARLRERLRQHMAVRIGMLQLPVPSITAAVGGSVRPDAYYFRLLARALEEQPFPESDAEAVLVWDDFRREAIKEGWFAAGGLEDGVLALHMAQLIEKLPAEIVEEIRDREAFYRKLNKGVKEESLPSAGVLFNRACEADPHPEAFQMWLNWARNKEPREVADQVAERWRKARAGDIQPLLYLMESAEKRSAFKKSLKYLEEAETLDRLNPEVRRAKLRLLLSAVLRHLRERKTHLAQAGIEQIETVPEVRPGEIAALAGALRWFSAAVDGDKAAIEKQEKELKQSLGTIAAHLLLAALQDAANLTSTTPLPALTVSKTAAVELLIGTAKACVLGDWAGLPIPLPSDWDNTLMDALHLPNCPLDAAQMLVLGEAALESISEELAYTVSSVGLAGGRANARFLFLRARSIPQFAAMRRNGCFTAALELARQERNTELAGKILDQLSGEPSKGSKPSRYRWTAAEDSEIASRPVSPELLSRILEEEKELEQYPISKGYRRPKYATALDPPLCDCLTCRASRGELVDDSDMWDDEDDDDFEDDDEDSDDFDEVEPPSLKNLTTVLAEFLSTLPQKMAKKVTSALAAGEDPGTAIDRIAGKEFPGPGSPAPSKNKRGTAARFPPPGQGSLF